MTKFGADYAELSLTLDGLTMTDSDGTTKIKGSSIETGSLALTGVITWGDLNSNVQSSISTANNTASSAASTANTAASNVAALANGRYSGGTFIDGTNLYSPNLYGDTINLMDGSGNTVGTMSMVYSNTYAFDLTSNRSLRLQAATGYTAYLASGSGGFVMCEGGRTTIGGKLCLNTGSYNSVMRKLHAI